MERISDRLQEDSWEPVALVQDGPERLHLLMKTSPTSIKGLMFFASDGVEAVMINVMGDLRPEVFSKTMAALDIDGLLVVVRE